MAKNKTTETKANVEAYVMAIENDQKREDCLTLIKLIQKQTKLVPRMWGTGIVGFGSYHYKYDSGHEGDAPLTALAARANSITLYLATNFDQKEQLLQKLGKHKKGSSCIYIKKLDDIDINVLNKMIVNSIAYIQQQHPE